MMLRTLRTPLMPAVLLAMLVALPVPALAGGARVGSAALSSTPFATATYGPGGVSGKATLVSNAGSGTTSVVVRVAGLQPGTTHIGHIHFGDATDPCARLQPGAIIEDLGPFVANAHGTAVARTVIETPTAGVDDCEWWVAIHEGPENATPQTPAIAIGAVRFVELGS